MRVSHLVCVRRSPLALPRIVNPRPHLRDPLRWALCEDGSCDRCAKMRCSVFRNALIRGAIWLVAVSYALIVADCFTPESPVLLLALLPLPSVAEILTQDASV